MSKLLLIVQWINAFSGVLLQMKKQKVILIKDFHNENGTLHAGEKVTIEERLDGYVRVQNNMGQLFVVPPHILKEIA